MNKSRFITYSALFLLSYGSVNADILDEFRNNTSAKLNEFKEDKYKNLEKFRRRVNEEIAQFMSNPWTPVKITPKIDPPVDPSPDPVRINMDTIRDKVVPQPIVIKDIITVPAPTPQPQPVEPIVEINPRVEPEPKQEDPVIDSNPNENPVITPVIKDNCIDVQFYGTDFSIRCPDLSGFKLNEKTPSGYADAWRSLNNTSTNNLIIDCLNHREEKVLCDWAFMKFIQTVSAYLLPDTPTKATLLSGFLLSQCGYRVRFATDARSSLHLLYSPIGTVYQVPFFVIDGYTYTIATEFNSNEVDYRICNFKCQGEKQMSFEIPEAMQLAYAPAEPRKIKVHNYPELEVKVTPNKNLIDFYDSYPVATLGNDEYSHWAIYANTPASPEIQNDLYPVLKEAIRGKTEKEAANILIHLAESFPYGYDSQIWGRDRAFFMDESWYYPLSDCEDHAIQFSRLIRDILGLETVLICYPRHLAAAVAFTDSDIKGDYVMHKGKRYIICDPTIFYADIGVTMPGCNNEEAVVIDLNMRCPASVTTPNSHSIAP